jgi:hypothetical protein
MGMNINGLWHSFATAEIDLAGSKFRGFSALNWGQDLKKEIVKGSGVVGLGYTMGDLESKADFEILYSEWIRFTQKLGDGWGYKQFNIGCQYRVPGKPLITVAIKNVTVNADDVSNSKGPGATMAKVTLQVVEPIEVNGITIIGRTLLAAQQK